MAIGSLDSFYTSGSLYRRFGGSSGSSYNKQSVAAYDAEVEAAGSLIFGQSVAETEGLSVLAAQAMQQRTAEELQAKAEEADAKKSTALNILA